MIYEKDIVGSVIMGVFQTPWEEIGGVLTCAVYVSVSNCGLIELGYVEPDSEGVYVIREQPGNLIPAEFPKGMRGCVGEKIEKVIYCDYWPAIGFQIYDGRILTYRDFGFPPSMGAYIYKPLMSELVDLKNLFGRH